MRVRKIEQILSMDGGRLLDELVTCAATRLDEDHVDAIVRAIQTRLAETGIAQKLHAPECRFMLGEDLALCRCSGVRWSWPRKGL